jgi:membrane-associated HD superfamily phosphohydrolase
MAGRRRQKAAAVSSPVLTRRPPELQLLLQEKGKLFLVLVVSLATTYIIDPPDPMALLHDLNWLKPLGVFLAILILNLVSLTYVLVVFPAVTRTMRRSLLLGGLNLLVFLLARLFAALNASTPGTNLLFFIPIGFAVLVFAIVYNRRFAVVSAGYLALGVGVVLHFHGVDDTVLPAASLGPITLLFAHLVSSVVAVLSVAEIRNRAKLIKVGAVTGLTHGLLIALFLPLRFSRRCS